MSQATSDCCGLARTASGGAASTSSSANDSNFSSSPGSPGADAVPAELLCPISQMLMHDPVTLSNGTTYDRSSIKEWFRLGHTTCPLTRAPVDPHAVTPNAELRERVLQWIRQHYSDEQPLELQDKALEVSRGHFLVPAPSSVANPSSHGSGGGGGANSTGVDGMEAQLATLSRMLHLFKNPDTQLACLQQLLVLASTSEAVRNQASAYDLVPLLLRLLLVVPQGGLAPREDISWYAAELLSYLSLSSDVRKELDDSLMQAMPWLRRKLHGRRGGRVKAIRSVVKRLGSKDVGTVRTCAWLLWLMSLSKPLRERMVNDTVIAAVTSVLQRPSSSAGCKAAVARVLRSVAVEEASVWHLVEGSAVQALVDVLCVPLDHHRHPGQAQQQQRALEGSRRGKQRKAAAALQQQQDCNCAVDGVLVAAASAASALSNVALNCQQCQALPDSTVQRLLEGARFLLGSTDGLVQRTSARLVRALASHPPASHPPASGLGSEELTCATALLGLLRQDNTTCLEEVGSALCAVVQMGSDALRRTVAQRGGVAAASALLACGSGPGCSSSKTRRLAAQLLADLASPATVPLYLAPDAGGVPPVQRALGLVEDANEQRQLLGIAVVLCVLEHDRDFAAGFYIQDSALAAALVKLVTCQRSDLASGAAALLRRAAAVEANHALIAKAGGVDAMLDVLKRSAPCRVSTDSQRAPLSVLALFGSRPSGGRPSGGTEGDGGARGRRGEHDPGTVTQRCPWGNSSQEVLSALKHLAHANQFIRDEILDACGPDVSEPGASTQLSLLLCSL